LFAKGEQVQNSLPGQKGRFYFKSLTKSNLWPSKNLINPEVVFGPGKWLKEIGNALIAEQK